MNNNCWYKSTCKSANTADCTEYCVRYYKLKELMNLANIPQNRQQIIRLIPENVDIEAFTQIKEVKDNIDVFVNNGYSLYIYSKYYGNGKTSWAIRLLQSYLNCIWIESEIEPRCLFIHMPSYINMIMENISDSNPEYIRLKQLVNTVDLVVWDFIPDIHLSPYQRSQLLTQIDTRLNNSLANIYTGNLSQNDIIKLYGSELSSRIYNQSKVIELLGTIDRRGSFDFKTDNK